MKNHIVVVDIFVMLGIFSLLVAAEILHFKRYLFGFPFVTPLAFYVTGKSARDYEFKLWDKRHSANAKDPSKEGDA